MEDKKVNIHKLIDEAMERKDKKVHIFISELGTNINIEPYEPEKDPGWIVCEEAKDECITWYKYMCPTCGHIIRNFTPYCPICGEQLKPPVEVK